MFDYKWHLSDGYPAKQIKKSNLSVFGTFVCGGGSSMGYKLAGFNHLGGVEIDKEVAKTYQLNHNPKFLYNEDIRVFNKREDLPKELHNLDILDGSPPCSTFSISGSREKAWGKEKVFREGQVKQTLDDLVFVYLDTINKLKPKVALLENVKGLAIGNAKAYLKKINSIFIDIGYRPQIFLLNAATMGVPQTRERIFIIGLRNDIDKPKLKLNFNQPVIKFKEIVEENCKAPECFLFSKSEADRIKLIEYGDKDLSNADRIIRGEDKNAFFNHAIIYKNRVCCTVIGQEKNIYYNEKRLLSNKEISLASSFPLDYNYGKVKPKYLMGMSVPPVMIANIAHQIRKQWF